MEDKCVTNYAKCGVSSLFWVGGKTLLSFTRCCRPQGITMNKTKYGAERHNVSMHRHCGGRRSELATGIPAIKVSGKESAVARSW